MEWRPFNTHAFLKQSKKWDEKIKEIEQKLAEISELPAVENKTGVRSGKTSDLTQQTAMKKMELQEKLDRLKRDKEMLQYALDKLGEPDRELINGFYFSKKQRSIFVWNYGRKYGLCKDYVYSERNRVLKEMGEEIVKKFYGGE